MQSEEEQKEFIKLYGSILKVMNILSSFDEFKNEELISERDKQDYHSVYIELYNEFKNKAKREKTDISGDVVFEMELIKSIEVNLNGAVYQMDDVNLKEATFGLTIQEGKNTIRIKLTNVNGLTTEGATEFDYAK